MYITKSKFNLKTEDAGFLAILRLSINRDFSYISIFQMKLIVKIN